MENKLYNMYVVTKIDNLDIYIHEFKVNKITKQYYFKFMYVYIKVINFSYYIHIV